MEQKFGSAASMPRPNFISENRKKLQVGAVGAPSWTAKYGYITWTNYMSQSEFDYLNLI